MPNRYKIIKHDSEARESILRGVAEVVDTVKTTLGPYPRNVLTDNKGAARVSDDGYTIATQIVLKDELENQAAQAVVEVAKKTREMVGDGTTTSMVLTGAIVREGLAAIGAGKNPMKLKKQIQEDCIKAMEELKKLAKPIKTKEEIQEAAKVALLDDNLGNLVGEMVEKVGVDGFISVEESLKFEHEFETTQGMRFHGTYAAPLFVTNERREAIFTDCPIIVVGGQLEKFKDLQRILEVLQGNLNKESLVIISEGFSNEVVRKIMDIVIKFKLAILPVKVPALTEEELEDIAVYTGGKFWDQKTPETSLDKVTRDADFGSIHKIKVDRDDVTIIGTGTEKEPIRCRIEMLKEHLKLESDETLKNRVKRRIASMSSGVGVIKVGSPTNLERNILFKKVENAVHSSKAAMEEGVVKGGGLALKEVAEILEKQSGKSILTEAMKTPYTQIIENSGEKLEIGEKIIDPVKVTRTALQNACSVAASLITCSSILAWKAHTLEDEVRDVMNDEEQFTKHRREE